MKILLWIVAVTTICEGSSLSTLNQPNVCGDWKSYKDEKCIKIVDTIYPQSQEDGKVICKAYSDTSNEGSTPTLLSIRSKEEQEFVQRFLFETSQLVDNVWLDLKKNNNTGTYHWGDGSDLTFNNWAEQTLKDQQSDCVQMESGDGAISTGLWFRANCRRKNAIVCEKRPSLSLEALQSTFLNFKKEQELKQKEWEEKYSDLEKKTEQKYKELEKKTDITEKEIASLKNNPAVPVGFIYVQLSHQDNPAVLWPTATWSDVSSSYAGLFFRVADGNTNKFGQVQEASSYHIEHRGGPLSQGGMSNPIVIPTDGRFSYFIPSGVQLDNNANYLQLRFKLTTSDLHPRNRGVRIWQRIK